MNTIKDRILGIIEANGMTQYRFETLCGLSSGYIKSIGEDVGSTKLAKILSKFPNISPDWLILGEGEMLRKDANCNYQTAHGVDISQTMINQPPNIAALIEQLRAKDEQIRHLQNQAASLTEMLHHVMCSPK